MYYRVHTADVAYRTGLPRGLFVAVGKLVEEGVASADETAEYWKQRAWFEAELPVPPFYADGNSLRAITWFKDNDHGRATARRMGFYRTLARTYGVRLWATRTSVAPGRIVYEDDWQIGVVESRHEGEGFETQPLDPWRVGPLKSWDPTDPALAAAVADAVFEPSPSRVQAVLESYQDPHGELWAAWDGERVVGVAGLLRGESTELRHLGVLDSHRRLGVGRALVAAVHDRAGRLEVETDEHAAEFYRRLGVALTPVERSFGTERVVRYRGALEDQGPINSPER